MLCFSGFELYSRWVPLLNFSRRLDFPYICLQFFPGNFSRREETCIFTDKCIEHFKKWFQRMQLQATLSIFFSRIVRSEALVYNSYFFQNSGFTKIIRHQILCNFSGGCLVSTRQDGFQIRDKVYWSIVYTWWTFTDQAG